MKKTIFSLILMAFTSAAFSQLGMGIKGAFTMNQLSTDMVDIGNAAKAGVQAGIFLRIGDKFHVQPEGYFSIRTGELTAKVVGLDPTDLQKSVDVKQGMTLSTVDIPLLIGYKIIDPPTMNIRLQAGPVISMVMNKKFDITFDGIEAPAESSSTIEQDFKDANWGVQFGVGADFLFLTVDVRYELGLTNIYKQSESNPVDFGSLKNNMFFVSVGWKFL